MLKTLLFGNFILICHLSCCPKSNLGWWYSIILFKIWFISTFLLICYKGLKYLRLNTYVWNIFGSLRNIHAQTLFLGTFILICHLSCCPKSDLGWWYSIILLKIWFILTFLLICYKGLKYLRLNTYVWHIFGSLRNSCTKSLKTLGLIPTKEKCLSNNLIQKMQNNSMHRFYGKKLS